MSRPWSFLIVLNLCVFGFQASSLAKVPKLSRELNFNDKLQCADQAVEEYLSQCGDHGLSSVSSKLRLQSAVKLSLCELADSQVSIPFECLDLRSMGSYHDCVQSFRLVPQLWTTYSGHYRKLRTLCFEEALPFTKTNILDLFFNVTEMYSTFYNAASSSSHQVMQHEEEASARLADLMKLMENALVLLESRSHRQDEIINRLADNLQSKSNSIERLWDSTSIIWDKSAIKAKHHLASISVELERILSMEQETSRSLMLTHLDVQSHLQTSLGKFMSQITTAQKSSQLLSSSLDANLNKSESLNHWFEAADGKLSTSFESLRDQYQDLLSNVSFQFQSEARELTKIISHDIGKVSLGLQESLIDMTKYLGQLSKMTSDIGSQIERLTIATTRLENFNLGSIVSLNFHKVWSMFRVVMAATLVILAAGNFSVTRAYSNAIMCGVLCALTVRIFVGFLYHK